MNMDDARKKQLAVSNIADNTKHVSISVFLIPVSHNCDASLCCDRLSINHPSRANSTNTLRAIISLRSHFGGFCDYVIYSNYAH